MYQSIVFLIGGIVVLSTIGTFIFCIIANNLKNHEACQPEDNNEE